MGTTKHNLVIGTLVANRGISLYKAMTAAGYSPNTAKNPKQNLLSSTGFQALAEEAGLTEKFLVDALVEDVKAKPGKRHKEIELGFKVLGTLQPPEPAAAGTNNFIQVNNINPNDPAIRKLAQETLANLMDQTKRKV